MSDEAAKERELADVELCYKAMGLSFSDPPETVSRVYRKLKGDYETALRGGDVAARKTAGDNLKQLEELYATITSSLIYKDYAREYEKYKQAREAERQEKLQKAKSKPVPMKHCPFCGKEFMAALPSCPHCRRKYVSPTEMMMQKYFTGRNIAIAAVVAAFIVTVVVLAANPGLFKR